MDYYDKIVGILDRPYFKNLNSIGIDEVYYSEILDRIYKEPVTIEIDYELNTKDIFNKKGLLLYYELDNNQWRIFEYGSNEKIIYHEDSDGYWVRREYNSNGKEIYFENSNGYWIRREFDDNGNLTYYVDNGDVMIEYN
jgi:hypothetical protein